MSVSRPVLQFQHLMRWLVPQPAVTSLFLAEQEVVGGEQAMLAMVKRVFPNLSNFKRY